MARVTDVRQLRAALSSLYRPLDLATSELCQSILGDRQDLDAVSRAQALRGLILDCIELLKQPDGSVSPASASRAFDCISLRYLSGLSVEEVAAEMCLSPRQVYRDLHWGEERLAALISMHSEAAQLPPQAEMDELAQEIESLARRHQEVELVSVLMEAADAVVALCRQRGVALQCQCPSKRALVTGNRGLVKQLLIQALSAAVQSTDADALSVSLEVSDEAATVAVPIGSFHDMPRRDLLETALRIARSQKCVYQIQREGGASVLRLTFALAPKRNVLIVEDNPSTFALYQRFLEDSEWQPVHAPHPRLAVELAITHHADALILDLMLPESDGWSVLQAIRTEPRTNSLPVIICSVLRDEELAFALGANSYLTKPLTRALLLQALETAAREGSRDEGE